MSKGSTMRLWFVAIALCIAASKAGALEIWLASTERCNSCGIYQRVAQARGYGRALQYAGEAIPILTIDKRLIAADVLEQLPPEDGPQNPAWEQTLTVLVMDVGRVLAAGNIAESADNTQLRQSEEVMFPPSDPSDDHPALRQRDLYTPFFMASWNLEYFVDVALGRQPKRSMARLADLAPPKPLSLGATNVILWGSAETPLKSSLFIATRLREIKGALAGAGLGSLRFVTLYGHGPGVDAPDTSFRDEDGRIRFKRAEIGAQLGADAQGLNSMLAALEHASDARTLLVQVGHSGSAGAPVWGHGLTMQPEDLLPVKRRGGQLVMVSGACHSGMFARAAQCGFFAAHPEVTTAGCQLSPAALDASDDYLRHFFTAATGGASPSAEGSRRRGATRVLPSLAEAHWYASLRVEDHQISYTTTDALIDEYFAAHPEDLPQEMSVEQIRTAAAFMTPADAKAVEALTLGLAPEYPIPLTGHVEASKAAAEKLAGAAELSSAERNAIADLPYKLMLPALARRAAYASLIVEDEEYAAAASCEARSLRSFFNDK
jgi:hypothetical protein